MQLLRAAASFCLDGVMILKARTSHRSIMLVSLEEEALGMGSLCWRFRKEGNSTRPMWNCFGIRGAHNAIMQ